MKKEIFKIFLMFNIILLISIVTAFISFSIDTNVCFLLIGYIVMNILYQVTYYSNVKDLIKEKNN